MMTHDSHRPIEALLAQAFHKEPAARANEAIAEVRQAFEEDTGAAANYEVVLDQRPWTYLRDVVAPRLALFLREKGLPRLGDSPAFVSLFYHQELFFLRPAQLFTHVGQVEGWTPDALNQMLQQWEQTGRPTAGLLPPPETSSQ